MKYEAIVYEKNGDLLTITLNKPQILNAMNEAMKEEIRQAVTEGGKDAEVRCIIITGAGRSFCVGNDMSGAKRGGGKTLDDQRKKYQEELQVGLAIWDCPKPVIAAVNGHCLGTGFDLALACDITIAAQNATFALPEVRHSSGGNTLLEPYIIGIKRTKELLFTGNTIGAEQAEKWGMVNRVVPDAELLSETYKFARKVALVPAYAVQTAKLGVNRSYEMMGLKQSLVHNAELMAVLSVTPTPEKEWFRRLVEEKGLKEALKARAEKYKD